MSESTDVKTLVKLRGVVKGKLTLFLKYIKSLSSPVTAEQYLDLDLRLNKISETFVEFEKIQDGIETLCTDYDVQLEEREKFENSFFKYVAVGKQHLNEFNAINSEISQHNLKPEPSSDTCESVKFPDIILPTFDGEITNWLEFRDTFDALINQSTLKPIHKLKYLRSCLTQGALNVITSLEYSEDSYPIAWSLLCERYNNPKILVTNHLRTLLHIDTVPATSSALRNLVDNISKHLRTLNNLQVNTENWDVLLIFLITAKLDKSIQRKWEERSNSRELPTLQDFKQFLRSRADLLESLHSEKPNEQAEVKAQLARKAMVITSPTAQGTTHKPAPKSKVFHCPYCKETHYLNQCSKFLALSVVTRIRTVKKLGLCINCLGSNHILPNCRASHCRTCKGKHNTLLHITSHSQNPISNEQVPTQPTTLYNAQPTSEQQTQSVSLHTNNKPLISARKQNALYCKNRFVILSTAQVNVLDSNNQLHTLRALLDSGSQSNFITEAAFKGLNLPRRQINIDVLGFNDNVTHIKHTCNLKIQSKIETFSTNLCCFVVPSICNLPTYTTSIQPLQIPHQFKLADDKYYEGGAVDLILGAEIFYDLLCNGRHRLGVGLPTLQRTRLGWVVSGSLSVPTIPSSVRCNFVQTNLIQWDFSESNTTKNPNDDFIQCEKIFQNHSRRSDGSFVVTLPLKEPATSLGQSRPAVYKRFKTLETKFERNPDFKEKYVSFMREFEQSGHMIKRNSNETCNYLPHHAVVNLQKSTTPLRVVIDASYKTSNGKSLNDLQYKGAVIQDELVNILLLFRKHKYVVSADIEKMYRMIHIDPNQRNLQCILWRENPSQPLHTYTLTTLSFGLKSAPYIATRCLSQLATENKVQYPNAATVINSNFYMDDLIYGNDDEHLVAETAVQVRNILKSANFNLRKWKSNSQAILNVIDKDAHLNNSSPNESTLTQSHDTHKILGLQWNSNKDNLFYTFKSEPVPNPLTKRKVLSIASAIFDPIGLLSPVLILAKCFIQQLWKNKISWDAELPIDMYRQWETFYKGLSALNALTIPRRTLITNYVTVELHGFADSSLLAYGSAVYIRSVDAQGNIVVRVLCSKTRVARAETIPRLELRAAHLLANLVNKVRGVLNINFTKIYLWSDSSIVLAWINSQSNKLNPFIKNRITDIKKLTNVKDWHWVCSSDNPADLLTRGVSADKLTRMTLWWQGPDWLAKQNNEWPRQEARVIPETSNIDTLCNVSTELPKNEFINELFNRWSKLHKLNRIFAYVLRFINNLKNKQCKIISSLTVDELNQSLNKLVMFAQIESFPIEYKLLSKNKPIQQTSNILCLKPFIDQGLIRVGGRLENSPYSYDKKHPILLHNKHILTKLVIQCYHTRLLHAGPQLLLSSLRERFWPINGKSMATKTVRDCVTCFRAKPQTSNPIMGALPASRVTPSFPFMTTGVDYAGPFTIRSWRGRSYITSKCYIALFVCFTTKAIHIELVSGLDTQSFLAAFRRFISRRGKPKHMVSDNGTQFHGANNELIKLYQFVNDNSNEFMTSWANEGIKWSYLPAFSPHMGGLHESAVKSCKYFLKRIVGQALLTYEEFVTVLIQVEGILNSRPLCPLFSTDVNDFSVLTPAHFLIGRSITTLPDYEYTDVPINKLTHFQQLQQLQQNFWRRWSRDYIGNLQQRVKWRSCKGPGLGVGTMVLVKDERLPPCQWRLGRIVENHDGRDGVTRVATINTTKGTIRRAFNNICPLPIGVY